MFFKKLNTMLKITHINKVIISFVVFVLLVSIAFLFLEDNINNYGEALWYSYVNLFTIGFGDIVVQNPISRILSVILTIYATIVIAIITGFIVTFYQENNKIHYQEMTPEHQEKLKDLTKCTKEELREISESYNKLIENNK